MASAEYRALPAPVDYAKNKLAREALLGKMNRLMQVDIPIEDPLWRYLRHEHTSSETGIFAHFDMNSRTVRDAYAEFYARTTGFGTSLEPLWDGEMHDVFIYGNKATTKNHSGDAIKIQSILDSETNGMKITAECLDGVTDMSKDIDARNALRERLRPLLPDIDAIRPDQIANLAISRMNELLSNHSIRDLISLKRWGQEEDMADLHPFLKQLTIEELEKAESDLKTYGREGQPRNERSSYQLDSSVRWIKNNIFLSLAYGTYFDKHRAEESLPGTTGSVIISGEEARKTVIESSSLADSIEITVYNSGQIDIKALMQNYIYDKETVLEIRKIMKSTGSTLEEAREILRKAGYFDDSYQRKRQDPEIGNVAVCDGSSSFLRKAYGGDPSISTSNYKLAKFYISDGVIAPFLPMIGQRDDSRLVELVRMLLIGDPRALAYVQSEEVLTLLDSAGLPVREKLSDDKSIIGFMFNNRDYVERVIKRGLFIAG